MKRIFLLLFTAMACTAHAQLGDYIENGKGSIKAGAGYVHDFPGVNGVAYFGEYSFPLNEWLQGGMGVKHLQTSGFPRSASVKEYTKATTLDFSLLFAVYHDETSAVRIGGVYSFSFYNVRRSFPVYDTHTTAETTAEPAWQAKDINSRISGFGLVGEYEYYFPNNVSVGARVSFCKAYNHVLMGGPFAAIRF